MISGANMIQAEIYRQAYAYRAAGNYDVIDAAS
jgi:hypothetical protein